MTLPEEILAEQGILFEDVRPETVDPEAHASFVITRVLDRGTMRSVAALVRFYGIERIRRFFLEGGALRVSRRTLPLWAAFLELGEDECTATSSPRSRSPFWKD